MPSRLDVSYYGNDCSPVASDPTQSSSTLHIVGCTFVSIIWRPPSTWCMRLLELPSWKFCHPAHKSLLGATLTLVASRWFSSSMLELIVDQLADALIIQLESCFEPASFSSKLSSTVTPKVPKETSALPICWDSYFVQGTPSFVEMMAWRDPGFPRDSNQELQETYFWANLLLGPLPSSHLGVSLRSMRAFLVRGFLRHSNQEWKCIKKSVWTGKENMLSKYNAPVVLMCNEKESL